MTDSFLIHNPYKSVAITQLTTWRPCLRPLAVVSEYRPLVYFICIS